MRPETFSKIVEQARLLQSTTQAFLASMQSITDKNGDFLDLNRLIPERDSSIFSVITRIISVTDLLSNYKKPSQAELIPLNILNSLNASTLKLNTILSDTVTSIQEWKTTHSGIQSINHDTFQITTRNGNTHDLKAKIHPIFDRTEALLENWHHLNSIVKPKLTSSFPLASAALLETISAANEKLNLLSKSALTAEKDVIRSLQLLESCEGVAGELARIKNESSNDRKTISEYLAEATQHKAISQFIVDEAGQLQIKVKNYQETFDNFQQQLDTREDQIDSGTQSLSELMESLNQNQALIEKIIARSNEMLSSATIAGLASNFYQIRGKLTNELWWARAAFYFGILFLTVCAAPLLLFVAVPFLPLFFDPTQSELVSALMRSSISSPDNEWQYVAQILARIAILFPAAWLVSFAAIRHSSLFRLREHYSYKYSMAVAVEGFKKQAPEFDQEIAALVLEQLAFNPADRLVASKDIKEGKVPGLLIQFILDKMRSKLAKTS